MLYVSVRLSRMRSIRRCMVIGGGSLRPRCTHKLRCPSVAVSRDWVAEMPGHSDGRTNDPKRLTTRLCVHNFETPHGSLAFGLNLGSVFASNARPWNVAMA